MARARNARVTKSSSSSSTPPARRQRSRLTPGSLISSFVSQGDGLDNDNADMMDLASSQDIGTDATCNAHDAGIDMQDILEESDTTIVESQEYFDALSQQSGKGKGRMVEVEEEPYRPFPLMDLPTEIRLEIYRACLTRPYKITLSRVDQQSQKTNRRDSTSSGDEEDASEDDDPQPATSASQRLRAGRTLPPATISSPSQRVANNPKPIARTTRPARVARSSSSTSAGTPLSNVHGTTPWKKSSLHSQRTTHAPRYFAYGGTNTNSLPTYDTPTKGLDPLIINILRTSKEIYKEARGVLYSENIFDLDINTAVASLTALHQRSRRQIKHVELEIPTYTEILEHFSEIVRLSLRYCTGLKKFVIHTPFTLQTGDGGMASSNTTVYANGFDILRWLPQQCQVVLKGSHNAEIEAVVNKHLNLAKTQDKVEYPSSQIVDRIV